MPISEKQEKYFERFIKAYGIYYGKSENQGVIPKKEDIFEVEEEPFRFGTQLHRYIHADRLPEGFPEEIASDMKARGLLSEEARNALTERKGRTSSAPWKELEKAVEEFYKNPKNFSRFPSRRQPFTATDGSTINFGALWYRARKKGCYPHGMPNSTREMFEKHPVSWAAFEEVIRGHYQNPRNLGEFPSKSEKSVVGDIIVRYGEIWDYWRKNGYPREMPESLRKLLEGYQREVEIAELAAPQWSQAPSGNTMSTAASQSELTSSFPFNRAAPFASLPHQGPAGAALPAEDADYPAALNFLPVPQTQTNTPGDYPSQQSGYTYRHPFSTAHHGQSHSSGGRGMRG
ncbi:hypothetical protein [Streptomyces sp. NPDC006012]|uniref:hypothetical protein n=1 Tax=Streptomyces sp. NPDC006012 TaxID=3364739 RepID=UPI0036ADB2B0